MLYQKIETSDRVYQGRMIVIATFIGFLIAWSIQFINQPVYLVPGFIFDNSLETFFSLLILLAQFGCVNLFLLLLWVGVGWARYVLGLILFLVGSFNVILSMFYDALGAPQLIYGSLSLVGAVAITLSLSITAYVKDRGQRGVPWSSLFVASLIMFSTLVAVSGIDLSLTYKHARANEREARFASDTMARFAVALDPEIIQAAATDHLRQELLEADFPGQCQNFRRDLGKLENVAEIEPLSLANLTLDPAHGTGTEWNTIGHYEKADVFFHLIENSTQRPLAISDFNFTVVPRKR